MIEMNLVICNWFGLHTRASLQIVNTSLKYLRDINLALAGSSAQVNYKSIMSLILLGALCDTSIKVTVSCIDEIEVAAAIKKLIWNHFGEEY